MTKKMVCIECPRSCVMSVDVEDGKVDKVEGAKCPKGTAYAISEVQNPVRILTATVLTDGLSLRLVPVRTDRAIPKKDLLRAMDAVRKIRLRSPLKAGDTIDGNFLGLGVKLLATREVS